MRYNNLVVYCQSIDWLHDVICGIIFFNFLFVLLSLSKRLSIDFFYQSIDNEHCKKSWHAHASHPREAYWKQSTKTCQCYTLERSWNAGRQSTAFYLFDRFLNQWNLWNVRIIACSSSHSNSIKWVNKLERSTFKLTCNYCIFQFVRHFQGSKRTFLQI